MITTRHNIKYNQETQKEILREIELLVASKIDILKSDKPIILKFKVEKIK